MSQVCVMPSQKFVCVTEVGVFGDENFAYLIVVVRQYSLDVRCTIYAHRCTMRRECDESLIKRAGRHAWTLQRGGDCTCLSSRCAPSVSFRRRRRRRRRYQRRHHHSRSAARSCYLASTSLALPPPPPLPRVPCQPTSRGRFRFVRAGAAIHQSLLVPAPAFDGRVAAARSVIARL